ncbi:M-phase phosphoprotein 6 [Ceratina calcarata]|uniref:M-phase phosphoprotein 6 n=1 Tax=Ceratina calcarata TaxID=156304 RepID=A0AAJ7NB88_9HYME|nr:M-phase phosphoprotein 6 [Ceratina calcarata]
MSKPKLSRSILEMKFMKRTKEKVQKQEFQEEGEEYFGNELTKRMKKESERFVSEPSYVFCEKLVDGRISFQGMNPEIEKLMEEERRNERVRNEQKQEADISDEQMAKSLSNYRKKTKVNYKRERSFKMHDDRNGPSKKPKFLKPDY